MSGVPLDEDEGPWWDDLDGLDDEDDGQDDESPDPLEDSDPPEAPEPLDDIDPAQAPEDPEPPEAQVDAPGPGGKTEIVFNPSVSISEGLDFVKAGSADIAVGISGFGSARLPSSRWMGLADLTGRTTYVLRYDAQTLPWDDMGVPMTIPGVIGTATELHRRWIVARMAAAGVSDHLAVWLRRWTAAGRRVLVVGFSLGGYVAWNACRAAPHHLVDVVLVSAAVADTPETWKEASRVGRLVNVYSRDDFVLRRLYPMGVEQGETPAAGLGPIQADAPNVQNIDVTDIVGKDHLKASKNLDRLIRTALACVNSAPDEAFVDVSAPVVQRSSVLPVHTYARLLRWTCADPYLWGVLGQAIDGEASAIRLCEDLDAWSRGGSRFTTLSEVGLAAMVFSGSFYGGREALRAYREMTGMIRIWLSSAGFAYSSSQSGGKKSSSADPG